MRGRFLRRELGLLQRSPSFRLLFLATLGSGLGTWLALVALQVDIIERTHSAGWISALLIADLLPPIALGFFVAPLVDRLSRQRLMIGGDLVRFGVFCALPFARNAQTIVGLAAVAGLASGFFRPAVYAGVPNLVEDRDLSSANASLQAVDNLTWAAGSLVGGVLVELRGPHLAYWLNAATFLVSASLISGIPQRLLQTSPLPSRGHWRDLAEGFALTRRSRALLTVLLAWNITMLANAAVNVGEPFLAFDSFNAGRFGLGLLMAAAGLGLALGALLGGQWIDQRGPRVVYGTSLGLMALGVGAAAAAPNVWVAAACVVLSGAGNGAAIVCNALFVQRGVSDQLRGRAFALLMATNMGMLTLGMVVAGRLTGAVGPRWIWAAAACLSSISAVVGFVLAGRSEPAGVVGEPEPIGSLEAQAQPGGPRAV